MELAPNVYWIKGMRANVYACVDGRKVTLVDTGFPGIDRIDFIFSYLERLGLGREGVSRILMTHADKDHAGNAAALQAGTGAIVYAGLETKALLVDGRSPSHLPRLVERWAGRFLRYPAVSSERLLTFEDGDQLPVLGTLRVLATPGHTRDHHAFYSPTTGVLFAGDALNTRHGILQSTPSIATIDVEAARRSAKRLLALSPAVIACGHGDPMTTHTMENLIQFQTRLG